MSSSRTHIKPFLKWAGGKRQLLPVIRNTIATNPQIVQMINVSQSVSQSVSQMIQRVPLLSISNHLLVRVRCYSTYYPHAQSFVTAMSY
jgi:hypothetical protein